jgi:hypothetical protein
VVVFIHHTCFTWLINNKKKRERKGKRKEKERKRDKREKKVREGEVRRK